jgi:Ca2+-binding EF-hand superfamily protein
LSDTRSQFQHFWRQFFSAERKFEALKYQINKNFCLREAFNFLDIEAQGFITTSDFRERLANAGFFATERELKGLMYRFDRDKDGRVTLRDFKDQFYI